VCVACAARASPIGAAGKTTLITAAYSTFLYQFDAGPSPSDALAKTQKYDTVTDLWASVRKIPTNRYTLAAGLANTYGSALAATVGTAIYVCGGSPPSAVNVKNEAYYPVTDTWVTKQAMPGLHSGGAIGATSTKIYIAGGFPAQSTLHIYDAAADTWAIGGPRSSSKWTASHRCSYSLVTGCRDRHASSSVVHRRRHEGQLVLRAGGNRSGTFGSYDGVQVRHDCRHLVCRCIPPRCITLFGIGGGWLYM
jgi:hypothetical protein